MSTEYCLELREVKGAPPNSWLVLEVIVRTPRLLTTVRRKYTSKPFHASAATGVVVQWLRPSAAAKALVRVKLLASQDVAALGDAGDVAAAAASDGSSELHKSSAADVMLPPAQPTQSGPQASAATAALQSHTDLQCVRVQLLVPPDAAAAGGGAMADASAGAGPGLGGISSNGGGHGVALPLDLYYLVRPRWAPDLAAGATQPVVAGAADAKGASDGAASSWAAAGGHAAAWGDAAGPGTVPPTPSTSAKKRTWLSALGFSRSGTSAAGSGQTGTDAARSSAGLHVATAAGEVAAGVAPRGTAATDVRAATSAVAASSVSASVPTPAGPSGAAVTAGVMGSFGRAELVGRSQTAFAAAAAAGISAAGTAPAPPPLQPREAGAAAAGPRLLAAPGRSGSMRSDVGDSSTPTGGLTAKSGSVAPGSTAMATATPIALSWQPSSTLPPESQASQQLLQPPKRRRLGDFLARLFGTSNHGHSNNHAAAANGNGGIRGRAAGADGAASASAAGAAASAAAAGAHATLGTTATASTSAGASPHSTGSLRRHPSLTNLAPLVPPSPCLGDVYRIQGNATASEAGVQVGFGSMTSAFHQAPNQIQQLLGAEGGAAAASVAASGRRASGALQHSGGSGGAFPVPMQIQPSTSASLPGLESPGAYAGELSPAYRLPAGVVAVEPPTGCLAAASLASPAAAAAAAAAGVGVAGRGGAGGAWTGGLADGAEDVAIQAAAGDDAADVLHLSQPSPMATSPGAPPGGCFLFWRYGSANARKQQQPPRQQLPPLETQPAKDESPAAAMGRSAGLHSGPASSRGIGRDPGQLRTLGRPTGGPSSASAASTPTHLHPGQHYLDQHCTGPQAGSGAGAAPPGLASTSVSREGTEGGAAIAGSGRGGPPSAGASAADGSGSAVTAAAAEAGAAVAALPHPLEAEVNRVMGWVAGQSGPGGMDEDVRVAAISQCQFLLDCLHNPDMSWLVPDSLLQLKHEVGFPFDSGVPIAGAPGWYRLVLQPMQLPQPPPLPQQLASPRSDAEQQQAGSAAAGAGDGHGALVVPAVTRPGSLSGGSAGAATGAATARQQPEVLKVRWSSIDQRAAGGANACAAIALEVALWCLAAMQRWRAATSAAAGSGSGGGSHHRERRGSGGGSGGGGSGGAAFGANGRTGSFDHRTGNSGAVASGGSHSRGLLPVLSRSQRERIASAAGIDMDAMSGSALEGAIRTGTAVWMGLLATSPAARVASSTGDFDLEHMLQLGGYGERLRLSEYIAATLIQPPGGGDASAGGGGGAPGRRASMESAGWEPAGSRRASRDGPGRAGAATGAGSGSACDAVAAMAAAAAGCGASAGSRPGPQPPLSSSPLHGGSLMFPTSLPLTPPPHHDSPGIPGSKQSVSQRATPGSEPREAPGTGGSQPGSHPRPPRPPRPPPLQTCASPDGGQHQQAQHVPHPPSMPPYRASQNGVPYFASLVRNLQQGVYVLGVHGHFTTLWLRPGGPVHVIDSLGARLAADCPLGFIVEFDCASDFLSFFLARHGVRGQAAAADADDISGGNLAALVEVHRLELTAAGVGMVAGGVGTSSGAGAGGAGKSHRL